VTRVAGGLDQPSALAQVHEHSTHPSVPPPTPRACWQARRRPRLTLRPWWRDVDPVGRRDPLATACRRAPGLGVLDGL